MSGTIIENLSGKKLTIIVICLLICQSVCFLIGGLIAPIPAGVQTVLGTVCKDVPGAYNNTSIWLYSRGEGHCNILTHDDIEKHDTKMANQIVFVFQMPLPRGGNVLDYSRWQQNLVGVIQADIAQKSNIIDPHSIITIDVRLAYRNKNNEESEWTYYASSLEQRNLNCVADNLTDDYLYSCAAIPLFELGSLHHDYYLLNIRLPVDSDRKMNINLGYIKDMQLTVIYQNGGFTKVWLSLKTIFFPFIVLIMIWFWKRVHQLQRSPALLEYMLIYLGLTLTFLNLPMEYFTLAFDMPFMLLLSDIRQGIFYAVLLSFWLIFAGEHMLIQDNGNKNTLKIYWKHLSAVILGCISLLIFDICERGVHLRNPFYSVWETTIGTKFALTFIILAGLSACTYFFFLCYMVWKVFCNISIKRSSLPTMSAARRLHYEGIIYRFQFLMLATLICAALTVIAFIMGQVAEGQWKWDDIEIEYTSAFLTGVYGMWNIYIFCLLILYAPSHKQWPTNATAEIISEEIEFNDLPSDTNLSEISSLTSFARKVAFE